jgi:peptidylprolyl isomerase
MRGNRRIKNRPGNFPQPIFFKSSNLNVMSSFRAFVFIGVLIAVLVITAGCTQQQSAETCSTSGGTCPLPSDSVKPAASATTPASATGPLESWKRIRLETNMGNITIALDPAMPITAGNFEKLAKSGYYNGVIFHRVIDGFMIQGGDPTGTGRGGPGYTIQDEYTSHNKNNRGAVAMANTGQPNSGGSQFFINLVDNSALQSNTFNRNYPVFGNVVEGMDIVDAIGKSATGPGDRPLQNVTIIRAVLI